MKIVWIVQGKKTVIKQLKITKDKTGNIRLEINNVSVDPAYFKATDNLNAVMLAMNNYAIDETDFKEICDILKHVSKA